MILLNSWFLVNYFLDSFIELLLFNVSEMLLFSWSVIRKFTHNWNKTIIRQGALSKVANTPPILVHSRKNSLSTHGNSLKHSYYQCCDESVCGHDYRTPDSALEGRRSNHLATETTYSRNKSLVHFECAPISADCCYISTCWVSNEFLKKIS